MYTKYDIDLKLEPSNHFLACKAKMTYCYKGENEKELHFYIHRNLEIEEITCDKKFRYEVGKDTAKLYLWQMSTMKMK
ncbi:MAG: hypothetical protein GX895_08985 [Clostridiales bacterium]|uniref:hypothetical protein n=1 Tax=Clostridium sp. N3C TaxID=1776758 RepID=UPI00092E1046|nr:hypothetical protein [Clostridium sp. N3C]NLZ48903.1 hypothetical protein [Clostridiales bacterium]SCN25071.1 hypothetical protein N3C_2148 [Clostridium sp. N3C]